MYNIYELLIIEFIYILFLYFSFNVAFSTVPHKRTHKKQNAKMQMLQIAIKETKQEFIGQHKCYINELKKML